jgi:hypothetical protein
LAALPACKEFQAEKPRLPYREVSASRSVVTGVGGEVGVSTSVTVRMLDARGKPVQKLMPAVAVVDGSGTVVAGTSSSGCTESDIYGNAYCAVMSTLPGSYYIKVTSPVSFTSSSTVAFTQITRSLSFSTQPSTPVVAGVVFPTQPVVRLLDRMGNLNVSGTETVTLSLTNAGSATIGGTAAVAAVGGIATFTGLSVDLVGSYSFSASTPSVSSVTSLSFTITVATPSRVAFTTQPSSSTPANVAFSQQPVVTFQDAYGNTVSSGCPVTLSLTSGTGTLLGTATKTAVAGVANFAGLNLRVNTSVGGSGYVLTATPQGACAAYTTGTSNAFTVTLAGAPYELLLVTPPSDSSLNEVWSTQPVVQVLDINGDLASSDNTTVVSITASSAQTGVLNGPSSVSVVNGVAAFTGLSIFSNDPAQAGTYTLDIDATNPGVAGFTNITYPMSINANGMVADRLLFKTQPGSASVNGSISTFEVKIVDANGYLCTACSDSVTVSYYYGSPSGGTMNGTKVRNAIGGIASFPGISFDTAGRKQIAATATGVTTAYSDQFSITSYGAASKLAFSVQPSSGGSTDQNPWGTQPVVQILDVAGNVVASDNSTVVTLACVNPSTGCTLSGTTSVRAVNGVATFNDLRTAETGLTNVVLSASASALTGTQSNSFTGNIGAPSSLQFAIHPVGGNNPWATQPQVRIYDSQGKLSTTATNSVTLSCVSASGTCTLTGTATVSAVGGIASFTGLGTLETGLTDIVIRATSGSLTSADSNSFTGAP